MRRVVATLRPRKKAEAFMRLRTFPGDQGQVDWGHFGTVAFGTATRKLYAFVMVLSYSRRIYLQFYLGMDTCNFLDGHQLSFKAFGGVPREVLYDNLKSCVLERHGDAVHYNPMMLEFAAHYSFKLQPVGIARGNEKGRVERAIRYIRESFFAARKWRDVEDLNRQAQQWCEEVAGNRPWADDTRLTVNQVFDAESGHLLALPDAQFPVAKRVIAKVGKTPYIRFDCNDYSVPHDFVRRQLTIIATTKAIRILAGEKVIATHDRCWSKKNQIENPRHLKELIAWKRRAKASRGTDRLYHVAPASQEMLRILAERGENLGSITAQLIRQLDQYGGEALERAIAEALKSDAPHPANVALILDNHYRAQHKPPPIKVQLPDKPEIKNLTVKPHALDGYDQIGEELQEKDKKEENRD